MKHLPAGLRRREGGGVPTLLLVGLGLALLIVLAAIFGHRRSQVADSAGHAGKPMNSVSSVAPPRVPNAARPTSSLPGAVAQAEAQARQWGPGGGPPVVIPDDTTSIQLLRPVEPRDGARSGAAAAPSTRADADMVAFAAPAPGTMTPCGNDTEQTTLRHRNHIDVEYRRNFMSWECRYLPTGSRAESKVEVDCDKGMLATWSNVFFRGGAQINETMLNEKLHAPRPGSVEVTLLALACALPQPNARASGRQPLGPDALAPVVDACFASAAGRLRARPSDGPRDVDRTQAAGLVVEMCRELSTRWTLACVFAGTPEVTCRDELSKRAVAALERSHQ